MYCVLEDHCILALPRLGSQLYGRVWQTSLTAGEEVQYNDDGTFDV